MADLEKPITTQEDFDAAIKERLSRESEKYKGYTSPADLEKIKNEYDTQISSLKDAAAEAAKKYANHDKELAERDAKIKNYETASVKARIAHEMELPYGAEEYLKGDDEASIKASAEAVKKLFGVQKRTAPEHTGETGADSKDAKLLAMIGRLTAK